MTIAHSARKIIKTQRFIFRALPALLVSVFVLNACSGAVPVTVNNSSASNEEIAKLKQDATTADNRITELEEASRRAGIAKTTADDDIIRLKNEAVQAGIAKASADSEIIILQGQLATAIGERGTANGTITTLRGQLSTAEGERDTANGRITTLEGELSTATGALSTASDRITELEGQLSTAIRERDAETGDKTTANLRITELEGELSTAIGERDTARGTITTLQGQLSTAEGERDTANGKVTTLQGQLSTVTGERDTANGKVTELEGELSTATTDKNTADAEVIRLTEALRLAEEARLQELRDNHSVIEFADWAGTAEAPKTTVKNAEGTGTEPLLNGEASVVQGNPRANFIQGLPTVAGQGFDFAGTAFADVTVVGDVLLLGEDSPSGVAFGSIAGNYYYAGLLPGTTLGAPITDINTSVIWDAKIIANVRGFSFSGPNYSNLGFKMLVTFDGSEGTINSGTVTDGVFTNESVNLSNDFFTGTFSIRGKFGTDGLLYGTVELDRNIITRGHATLTGLIGVDGAVGAFTDVINAGYLAGGFVAYPSNPRITELEEKLRLIEEGIINFADWGGTAEAPKKAVRAGNFDIEPLLNGTASVVNFGTVQNFIQGLPIVEGQGFDFTGTAFSDATVVGDVLLLGENSPSGVAFSRITRTNTAGRITSLKFYAGLLPTTTLGAPITDINTDAIWDAKVALSDRQTSPSFKMRVTFDGSQGTINSGTVSSGGVFTNGVAPNTSLNIRGRFRSDGLLYGTTGRGVWSSTLTGLIGVDGAVGAFWGASGPQGIGPYIGGFVAYPTDPRIAELEEELRLAEEARLQEIRDNHHASYSRWVARVNPDAKADLTNPRSQFLQSKNRTLDKTGVTLCRDSNNHSSCGVAGSRVATHVFTRSLGNSSTSSFDGQRINGDRNDGYGFFRGYIGETYYHYAGIFDSTDLGLPLTGDAGTSVQWNGSLGGSTDFVLTITFDANGGRLDAFVNFSINQFYRLQNARFDTGGVITGTVNYQYFTDSDPTKPIDYATDGRSDTGDLVLSGIIGEEGAVAVFVGESEGGGFVASPDFAFNPDVRASDWTRNIGDIRVAFTSAPRNQFLNDTITSGLRANSDGHFESVTVERLATNTATFNGNPLGGSGGTIAFFNGYNGYNGGTRHYYSSLYRSSDLGATLPVWETGQSTSAEWRGQFSVLQGANARENADLTLTVDFENRRLTAFVPVGTNHYLLDAGFNISDDGFFAGTVNFGAFTDTTNRTSTNTLTPGVLTGIIGVEGAMGAFVSGSTTDNGRTITGGAGENGFAGGFVVDPTVPEPPPVVNFADWLALVRPDAKADLANPRGQFLQSKDGTLDTTGVTFCPDSNSASRCEVAGSRRAAFVSTRNLNQSLFDRRDIGGDTNDGYAFFDGFIGETQYFHAGILDSTDLGTPLTGDAETSVQWNGAFGGNNGDGFDFVLTITFDVNGGRLDAFVNLTKNTFYRFQNARFDTGGVITGTVNLQNFTDSDPTQPIDTATDGLSYTGDSVLSGIIGEEGAVAVFVGASIAGGFVADPDITPNPDLRTNDWTRKVGDIRQAFTSVPRNQFLHRPELNGISANPDGTGSPTISEYLSFSTATFNGNPLGNWNEPRISFFSGYNGGIRHYYSVLHHNTLGYFGATLPVWQTGQPTSAEWKGQFGVVQGANARVDADLTLTVNLKTADLPPLFQSVRTIIY